MLVLNDEQFGQMVQKGIDNIPPKYGKQISNVAFVTADVPSEEQRTKLKLSANQSLYGLYEGIPLTSRSSGYNLVLPDKITIFRIPIIMTCRNLIDAQELINKTIWHEVAHYFGLGHDQIHKLE